MAKNKFYRYIGAMTVGAVVMAMPSCSDTWDEHYAPTDPEVATQTLWEQISSNPKLTRFAAIAKEAKYYKDETHPVQGYTFADLLNSNQVVTVWAPEDDAFTQDEYKRLLELCKTDGYNVQQQFLGNHIATWRYALNGEGLDTIRMINSKNIIFDRDRATMQGVAISERNIPAINGTLHTLKEMTAFEYNFYEYIKFSGALPEFEAYVRSKDTTYFFRDGSIEGMPDKDGNPTYVDSVYRTSNRLFNSTYYLPSTRPETWVIADKGFGYGSSVTAEDSLYIMLLPTDQAWNDGIKMLEPYYKYAPLYRNRYTGIVESEQDLKFDTDSIRLASIKMDMISPLVYNLHKQPKIGGKEGTPWTMEQFVAEKGERAEYFLNTYMDTLRSTPNWDKTELFNGKLVEMSNGYGFELSKWNFAPEYYKPDVNVEMGYSMIYDPVNNTKFNGQANFATNAFSVNTFKPIIEKFGTVSKNNFYQLKPDGTTNPKCEVKLYGNTTESYVYNTQVMSGKYDIYLVMVPLWYADLSANGELDSTYLETAVTDSVSALCKNKVTVQIKYDGDGKEVTSSKYDFEYDGSKVDTILVASDFEFPYSYRNLTSNSRYVQCFPTMLIQSSPKPADIRKGYVRNLCIDRIILRSKESGPLPKYGSDKKTSDEDETTVE